VARKPADQSVNREEIILAAADVLRRKGYDATTMKDIAAQVNLTAASLYHHFANKDALIIAVLEGGLDYAISQIEPVMNADMPHARKLAEMVRLHVVNITDNTAVGAAMVFEVQPLLNLSPSSRNGYTDTEDSLIARRDSFFTRRDYFEEMFRQVIQSGIEAGEFRSVDVPIFVKSMLGAQNWVGVWYREGGRLNGEAIAALIADTFLHALKCE
jgi:TetR/AcrR family transcriptional regulator, cholesterol catabolism regulator